jgi:hypothetical protein
MPDADTWLVASQMYSINDENRTATEVELRRFPAGLSRRVVVRQNEIRCTRSRNVDINC